VIFASPTVPLTVSCGLTRGFSWARSGRAEKRRAGKIRIVDRNDFMTPRFASPREIV
jgi:hypothetical protein